MARSWLSVAVVVGVVTAFLGVSSPAAIATHGARTTNRPGVGSTSVSGLSVLNDVACPTSKRCIAVGADTTEFTGKSAVISVASGSVKVGTGKVKNGALNAVACPTTSRCLAVADEQVASIAVASGATRQTAKLAAPTNGIVALGDIACPSKHTCYGVGFEGSTSDGTAIVAAISGAGKVQRVTKGHGTGVGPIACPSSTRCLMSVSDAGKGYIQLLNNGHFGARHRLPNVFIESMSCYKGKLCVALGGKRGGSVSHIDELFPLDPKKGKIGKVITLHGFQGFSIDCFTATKCTIVGETSTSTTPAALTVTKRKAGTAKHYSGSSGASLHASACADPTHCYGVGNATKGALVDRL